MNTYGTMVLLPKEHGAYGQLTLPVVTALSAAGMSAAGLLLSATAVAAFVSHEPAAILLGLRGTRARRELRRAAVRWLTLCAGVTAASGTLAFFTLDNAVRWSLAVPVIPATLLAIATIRGREKSWYGEVAAAVAFAGLAVPVSMAAGASSSTAAAIAVPYVLLFVGSTLAVRAVILRVRGGGNAQATTIARGSAIAVTAVGALCVVSLVALEGLPPSALAAASPGSLTTLLIAAHPPPPTRLRTIGWILVATSVITGAIVVATV